MNSKTIKFLSSLLVTVTISSLLLPFQVKAEEKYIKTKDFIKELVIAMKIPTDSSNEYVENIIEENEFDLEKEITRINAAVILNHADKYINSNSKVETSLFRVVKNERISDIKTIKIDKVNDAVDVIAKGIMTGTFNGYYVKTRAFKPNKLVEYSEAMSIINKTVNLNKRSKLSPDGQLIRTTNLPINADKFDYILVTYPNSFYERKFNFDWGLDTLYDEYSYPNKSTMKDIDVHYVDYTLPYSRWESLPLEVVVDNYRYQWEDLIYKYVYLLFNIDYKTIGNKEKKELINMYDIAKYPGKEDTQQKYIQNYINYIKKNKVTIKTRKIAVEPSTLYYQGSNFYMRVYLEYKVDSEVFKTNYGNDYYKFNDTDKSVLYAYNIDLLNPKSGAWRTGYFDIELSDSFNGKNMGDAYKIQMISVINDYYTAPLEID